MLVKYGIITLNKGSTDINRLLEQNNFIENEEYLIKYIYTNLFIKTYSNNINIYII